MLIGTGCLLWDVRKQQPPSRFSKGLQSSGVGNGEISTVVQTLKVRSLDGGGAGTGHQRSHRERLAQNLFSRAVCSQSKQEAASFLPLISPSYSL